MRYFIAILFPPLAVLFCGKPFQAILNFFLLFLYWVPAVAHALVVVASHKADKRHEKLILAMDRSHGHR